MIEYAYMVISICVQVFQNAINKKVSKLMGGPSSVINYGAYRYGICCVLAVLIILITRTKGVITPLALGLTFACAVSLATSTIAGLLAMKQGTVILVSLFSTAGLLVPCISGIWLFHEPLSLMQYLGMAILIVAAYLLVGCSRSIYKGFTFKTFILLFVCFLCNGVIDTAQKLFALYCPESTPMVYSILTFGMASLFFLVQRMVTNRPGSEHKAPPMSKKLYFYGAILGATLLVINVIATACSATIPAVILFPVMSAGVTILTSVMAAVLFKEKLTIKSVIGLILSIASLIMVSLA